MDWKDFQETARLIMSKHFGVFLGERNPPRSPKEFDFVSPDGQTVGDAKYLTLVHRKNLPPAKFMEIAGHVWLLENTKAEKRFLVFGNQRRVAEWWLEKYGHLVRTVEFYFIDSEGMLEKVN